MQANQPTKHLSMIASARHRVDAVAPSLAPNLPRSCHVASPFGGAFDTHARLAEGAWQTEPVTRFRLIGEVNSDDLAAVRPVLAQMVGGVVVTEIQDGLHVEGTMEGADARDVNRRLLSALRRVERRTRLRAEWTGSGSIYRFFDYVPKSTRAAPPETQSG